MTAQTPTDLLAAPVGERIRVSEELSGFGGLHGGLALALLTSAMGELVDGRALRSATAQFLRPIQNEAAVRAWVLRHGRVMSATEATAGDGDEVHVHASALWGTGDGTAPSTFSPTAPAVPPPDHCPVFTIPPEIVPFGQHVEVLTGRAGPAVHRRPNGRARRLAPTRRRRPAARRTPHDHPHRRPCSLVRSRDDGARPSAHHRDHGPPRRRPPLGVVALGTRTSGHPQTRVPTAGSTSTSMSGASMAPTWPRRCSSV